VEWLERFPVLRGIITERLSETQVN
jgi:hypothetical protein